MNSDLVARARSVINPFVVDRVDKAWDSNVVDVAAINRTAFECASETIELVRATGQTRGLLLSGEPGSGKTHLLQRLRRHIQQNDRDSFVYMPLVSAPNRFFRYLLQITVNDLVGMRTGSSSSQLETLIVREMLNTDTQAKSPAAVLWADFRKRIKFSSSKGSGKEVKLSTEVFWADVRKRNPPGEALFAWLEGPMERLCDRLELDPEVALALRHYMAEYRRNDAKRWLLGDSVPEAVVERLGLGRTIEEDTDALHTLVALSRLVGRSSVLVLAFDQLEGLQVDEQDKLSLRAFANGVVQLFVECRNIAAISCVQTYFKQDLERAVPSAHMDRLAQDQGALTLLDEKSACDLVAARLGAIPELNEARETVGEPDSLWPISREDIQRAIPAGGIPARHLLKHCRDRFDAWRRGKTTKPVSMVSTETLDDIFETRIEKAATEAPDEGVFADGLLKLIEARTPGKAKRATERDVDIEVNTRDGEIGVAVCHGENMTSFASRLKRLQSVSAKGRYKRLVLVRDARLRIKPTAKTTQDRLKALSEAGHVLLRPPAEAYAAIAAARELLAEAAAGDLYVNGQNVGREDLKTWLGGHLHTPVAELLDALEITEVARSDEVIERVQEWLEGHWVAPASGIASSMGIEESALLARLTTEQRTIGVLLGTPTVLFLRPEGLRRE